MSGTWTMRDGTTIKIEDMTDSHLLNSMKMLERSVKDMREDTEMQACGFLSSLQGEMASYYAEQEVDALMSMSDEEYLEEYTEYSELRDEYEKRKAKGELVDVRPSASLLALWKKKRRDSNGNKI